MYSLPAQRLTPADRLRLRAQAELELRRRQREVTLASFPSAVEFGRAELGESYSSDVEAMMRSVVANPVTLARSANGTGKTHGAARVALWFYLRYPDAQVYTAAAPPESNLKNLLWGEIGALVEAHPHLFAGHNTTTMRIERSSISFLTGVTIPQSGTAEQRKARFSGKHAPHLLFIIDEGDAVPPEIYEAIESCMSGGYARLLALFNPRAGRGPTYRMEMERRAKVVELVAFNHPNVMTGREVFPGAVDREKTVRRINEWSRPLAPGEQSDHQAFEVPEALVGATARGLDGETTYSPLAPGWRRVTDPALYYMVLARYPAQSIAQLISREWINAARSRWDAYVAQHGEVPPRGVEGLLGLDVAEFGDDSTAAYPRYGGWVARAVVWSGVDPDSSAIRAAELAQVRKLARVYVDATGLGAGVPPRMARLGVRDRKSVV